MVFRRQTCKVQICLATTRPNYDIGDTIQGEVLLTPQKKILPQQLNISFEGKAEIEIDKNGNNIPLPPSTASSTFLQMKQPIETYSNGIPKVFEPETTYQLPFEFVVPAELPHQVCHHHRYHEQIYWEHTQLPPSIGTPINQGGGKIELRNDMAPAILFITYRIHVRIHSPKTQKNGDATTVGEWTYPVHIRPQRTERPPIWVPDGSKFYCMRQNRQIAKGLRRRQLGLLSAWVEQPSAIRTQGDSTTSIKINLQYTATGQDPLPNIAGLDLKLKSITAYGAETWSEFPDLTDPSSWISSQDYYSDTISLHSSFERQVLWRESPVSGTPLCYNNTSAELTHTATLELPVILPEHLSLPPSFYSCLVSRTYSLKLSIYIRVAGQWNSSKVSLTVPVQIC